jgi:hypothetical protein
MSKNLIGESFKPYVKTQIQVRQDKLKKTSERDNSLLKYITNKTSWIRLTSGVDVEDFISNKLGRNNIFLPGPLLAKNNILSNIPFDLETGSTFGRYVKDGDILTNQGYVPLPGIISADVKSLNKGSLREAIIQITCHSIHQFQIIEALYLKLKYSMLLEWGHSIWYDNQSQYRTDMPDETHKKFLDGKYDTTTLLKDLENNRDKYCGNYDGFLGSVRNFTWSLRPDGGYDITLNLISVGDIIESLKLNLNYPGKNASPLTQPIIDNNLPLIIANKNKSTLNQILYSINQELVSRNTSLSLNIAASSLSNLPIQSTTPQLYIDGFNQDNTLGLTANGIISITKRHSQYDLGQPNYVTPTESVNPNIESNILARKEAIGVFFTNLTTDTSEPETFCYIKLGALLRIIESFLLKYDDKSTPLFYIDHDYDTNFCLTIPQQVSLNPSVSLLRPSPIFYKFTNTLLLTSNYQPPFLSGILSYIDSEYGTFRPSPQEIGNRPFLGRFMHIPVNIQFIISTIDNNIDNEGKLSLYSFLKELMNGIQVSLGNINNFEVTYDEVTNYLTIRDNNYLPDALDLLKKDKTPTQINVNTLNSSNGSFVKDVSLKSELNNNFASIISIGAQFNGNKVGENATALSKLNNGFTDRLTPTKSSYLDNELSNSSQNQNQWGQIVLDYANFINNLDKGIISPDDSSNILQEITDLFKYELGTYTQQNNIPGVGFIPLNLQITMDGLSGPRIYEVYTINETFLPDSYKDNIQFITRAISHRIDNNGWVTTLESFSAPKSQNNTLTPLNFVAPTPSPESQVPTQSAPPSGSRNADNLRTIIKLYNFKEKGKELDSSGNDITNQAYDYAYKFIQNLSNRYPSYKITFTAGNDRFHKNRRGFHPLGKAFDITIDGVKNRITPAKYKTEVVNGVEKTTRIQDAKLGSEYTQFEKNIINNIIGILSELGFFVIDEYTKPSKYATGGHIHFDLRNIS